MKSTRVLLGVAGLVFIVTLITAIPARVIDLIGGDALRLSGASGTLWNGSAQQVMVGRLQFGRTQWRTSAGALLLGRLKLNVDTALPGGFARGDVSLSLGGTLRVSDFEAAGPLEALGGMLGFPQASGEASVAVTMAELSDGWPTRLVGTVRLGNIPLAVAGVTDGSMINILTEFDVPETPDDGRVPGAVSDQGGPLQIAGTITFYPPANYDIDSLINVRADAAPELRQGLALLGPEGPNGSRQFAMSGSL
jgi:general secretion pathway protein N